MMRRLISYLTLVITGALAAACLPFGPSPDAVLRQIRGLSGDECIGGGEGYLPDLLREVPCSEPHSWELLGVADIPPEYAGAPFQELMADEKTLNDEVTAYGLQQCVDLLANRSGLGSTVGRSGPFPGTLLWPSIAGEVVVSTPPEALWPRHPKLYCSVLWVDQLSRPIEVSSPSGRPLVESFASGQMPGDLTVCTNYSESGLAVVACEQPHDAQWLFSFDATEVFGAEWAAAVDWSALSEEQWAVLDEACLAAGPGVFGAERTQQDVVLLADTYWFWQEQVIRDDYREVMCFAAAADPASQLVGQVWGIGDEPVELVPLG